MEQIPPPPSVTATRTQSPYPPSYRNRSSATHFSITLDNTPLRFPHRISAGLTRVQDICYLAIPGFRPPLAIHKLLYINFDTEPHPWATPHVNFNRSYRLYFIRGKALSFVTLPPSIQHPPPPSCWTCDIPCQSPHLRTMPCALSVLLLQMTSKCHFSSIAFHSKWPDK